MAKRDQNWLNRHVRDPYVQKAQQEGYRSRAAYKLQELNARDHIFRKGMTVVDLGAAPGGWSQVARTLVGSSGKVIAIDLLDMDPISGVTFIKGDFREDAPYKQLLDLIGDNKIDLVISDMAPNLSGMKAVDQPKSAYLVELALHCADEFLRPGGHFLAKAFEGEGIDTLRRDIRTRYTKQVNIKPKASRSRSKEIYLLGLKKKK